MKPSFTYDSFAYQELVTLIAYLKQKECTFYSCIELGKSPRPRGVSFRYDVHARDIAGAYGFLAAHYRHNIPGTFFLLADYSNHEYECLSDFLALARKVKCPVEIGLHDSPVDSYLIGQKFKGVTMDYWRWLKSDHSVQWFSNLARSESDREQFHADVLNAFCARVERVRKQFGEFNTIASHGGELHQTFRKRIPDLGPTGEFIASLFAENWLTESRLASVRLEADVEQFRKKAPLFYQVTEGGGLIKRMLQNLETFIGRDRSVQILIHPYIWAGPDNKAWGNRDAEISVLLGAQQYKRGMGGRKWWQVLLRSRWMTVPAIGPSANYADLPTPATAGKREKCILLCATAGDLVTDAKHAGVPANLSRIIVVETGTTSRVQSDQISITPLFDYLTASDPARVSETVVVGRSVAKYGELIKGAIESATRAQEANHENILFPQRALAQWVLQYLKTPPEKIEPSTARLDKKELQYFLFSSSQRSHVLKRILDQFLGGQSIACFVDHGAGIGIIPLCANFACNSNIKRIECSEIKQDFITTGTQLWNSLEYADVIHYQKCSATDFVYPEQVTCVLFAQMLYRIAPEKRGDLISTAWDALSPGGLLIINEIMDQEQSTISNPLLTSDELLKCLPMYRDGWLFWNAAPTANDFAKLRDADKKIFKQSDNFIVLRK